MADHDGEYDTFAEVEETESQEDRRYQRTRAKRLGRSRLLSSVMVFCCTALTIHEIGTNMSGGDDSAPHVPVRTQEKHAELALPDPNDKVAVSIYNAKKAQAQLSDLIHKLEEPSNTAMTRQDDGDGDDGDAVAGTDKDGMATEADYLKRAAQEGQLLPFKSRSDILQSPYEMWLVGISSIVAVVHVVIAFTSHMDEYFAIFEPDGIKDDVIDSPGCNIYRMMAVKDPSEIARAGKSPLFYLCMALGTAQMQSYLPVSVFLKMKDQVLLRGLKLPEWYAHNVKAVMTSFIALTCMGIVFIKNTQNAIQGETQACYHLLVYEEPGEGGAPSSRRGSLRHAKQVVEDVAPTTPNPADTVADAVMNGSPQAVVGGGGKKKTRVGKGAPPRLMPQKSDMKKASFKKSQSQKDSKEARTPSSANIVALPVPETPQPVQEEEEEPSSCWDSCFGENGCISGQAWEAFWCYLSLFVCMWTACILSVCMILEVMMYDGDISKFVLSVLKIYFLMSIDENTANVFPDMVRMFKKDSKSQTHRDDEKAQKFAFLKYLSLFLHAVFDCVLLIGIAICMITYWTNPSTGNMIGIGAPPPPGS